MWMQLHLNVDEPVVDYWKDIAKYWKRTGVDVRSLCNNCVKFDVSPRMLDMYAGETSDDDGRLGYCWTKYF